MVFAPDARLVVSRFPPVAVNDVDASWSRFLWSRSLSWRSHYRHVWLCWREGKP